MIFASLALFDLVFYGALGVLVLFLLSFDQKGWAVVATIGLILGLSFTAGWSGLVETFTNRDTLAAIGKFVVTWAGIGFAFSFMKWYFFARKTARSLRGVIERSTPHDQIDRVNLVRSFNTDQNASGILRVIAKEDGGYDIDYSTLKLAEYVASWTVYWPFYAILLVFEDFLKEVFDWLTKVFGKTFRRLATYAFSDIK